MRIRLHIALLASVFFLRTDLAFGQESSFVQHQPARSPIEDCLAGAENLQKPLPDDPTLPSTITRNFSPRKSDSTVIRPKDAPVPIPIDRLRLAELAFRERAIAVLKAKKFTVVNDNLGEGHEGFAMVVRTEDGILKIAKVAKFEPDRLVGEALHGDQVWRFAHEKGKDRYFLDPEALVDRDDSVIMLTPFFPRSPRSEEPAPTLKARLTDGLAGFSPEARIRLLENLTDAALTAHDAGMIHRDLKPGNILVDDAGNISVIDWGLSAEPGQFAHGTREGDISGTLEFLSENQWKGGPADRSDDLAALRRDAWMILGAGADLKPHRFNRNPFGRELVPDFKYAPEIDGIDPKLASAVWSRLPQSVRAYDYLRKKAQTLPDAEFYKLYGDLIKTHHEPLGHRGYSMDAAYDILGSKALIANFPDGLKLDPDKRDSIIRATYQIRKDVEKTGVGSAFGPHPYLHYDLFFERVRALEAAGAVVPKDASPLALPRFGNSDQNSDALFQSSESSSP